jgi:hypothetical protein
MTDSGAAALKELGNQTHGSRPAGAVSGLIGSARRTRSLLPRGALGAPRPIARQGGGCPRLGLTPNRAERLAASQVRRTLRTVAGNHRELPRTVGILRRSSSAAIAANVSPSDRSEATTSLQQLGQADLGTTLRTWSRRAPLAARRPRSSGGSSRPSRFPVAWRHTCAAMPTGWRRNVDGGLATSTPELDWPHDLSSAAGLPFGRSWTVRARG